MSKAVDSGLSKGGWRTLTLAVVLSFTAVASLAAEVEASTTLSAVTVTATRVGKSAFEVPAAIDRVVLDEPMLGISLAEALQGVPGLSARDRENYAQDAQISIRGFGARAAFGIRGVRLYVDGIPATQPDGQGQMSHFNLATSDHIEVLRGPFSSLYGNSSGGVVQLFSAEPTTAMQLDVSGFAGSYGDQRFSLVGQGHGVAAGVTLFKTDGYRPHSAAKRSSANLRFDHPLHGGTLTLLLNHLDAPDAQDPLGLSRAQFESNPRQTASAATLFNTRKSVRQTQLGAIYQAPESRWGALRLMVYGGQRDIEQFLSIPIATQANARHGGGVVQLGSAYGGGDLRWSLKPIENVVLVAGLSGDMLRQHRQGAENFIGSTLGVVGRARRDEINRASAIDQYLQVDWLITPSLTTLLGVRHSWVRFESQDRYIAAGNPDDSGALSYSAFTPVAGLTYRHHADLRWYASYGTGFETPTLAELAYRPDGGSGLNTALAPSRSSNAELGVKWHVADRSEFNAAIFRSDSRNELVTASNTGGRASFTNATRTRRDGGELRLDTVLTRRLDLSLGYTALDATVRESYRSCANVPCSRPDTTVARGTPLAGVAQGQLYSRLRLTPLTAVQLTAEYRYVDAVPVNDRGSESAPSYGVTDLLATWRFLAPDSNTARLSLRLENIFDVQYAGSVIVNEGNGRYYEPARGRAALVGFEMQLR